jgi:N-acetylglucosamine kinase-like BadF-type ATPase
VGGLSVSALVGGSSVRTLVGGLLVRTLVGGLLARALVGGSSARTSVCKYPRVKRDPLVELPPELTHSDGAVKGPSTRPARYLLGIDGGATKTLAAVLDVERREVHLGHGASANQDADGVRAAGLALFGAADQALAGAGIADAQLSAAVLAVAGTDTDAVREHVYQARSREWVVVGDVVGAWATATGARPGVGAIAGTGSNVFGVSEVGGRTNAWRVGGWGHVLGDEGSAYWLALQAVKAALRDRERSGPETALSEAALEFFKASSLEELAPRFYDERTMTKGRVAEFAVRVAQTALAGDAVARELYAHGARELGGQIAAVIEQTGLHGAFPVGLIGGAFKVGAVYVDPLAATIHKVAPEAQIEVVEMAPVGGALLLAARACGAEDALAGVDLARLIDLALSA